MANPYAEYAPQAANPYAQFAAKPDLTWSDVPLEALKNAPKSAVNLVENLVQPILHPVDTAKALGSLASGFISKTGRPGDLVMEGHEPAPLSPEDLAKRNAVEAPADAVWQFFKDRYGSGEGIKKTLATDPVGAAADLAGVLTGGAGLAGRGTMVGGTLARASSVVDPLTNVGRVGSVFSKVAEPVISQGLGFSTGAGPDAIRTAARAGFEGNQAFPTNMRGNVPATDMVDMAQRGLAAERADRGANYQAAMAPVKADATQLDMQPIRDAFAKANEIGSFEGVPLRRSTAQTSDKIAALLNEWQSYPPDKFRTAGGLDALKQAIGDVRDSTEFGTPSRRFADTVYHGVGNEIKRQVPEYADTMAAYGNASDQINNLQRTFSLGEKATDDQAVRKLQSVMRNNVQTNYGERERLMNVLAKHEPDLPFAIAGQALNSATPRGLVARGGAFATMAAATHNPLIAAALLAESPRVVGEGAYLAGRGASGVSGAADALGINAGSTRAAGQGAVQVGETSKEMKKNKELARLLMQRNEQRPR